MHAYEHTHSYIWRSDYPKDSGANSTAKDRKMVIIKVIDRSKIIWKLKFAVKKIITSYNAINIEVYTSSEFIS